MNDKYANIVINYPKNLKSAIKQIIKELKRFVDKYKKILVLDNQKEIEINFVESEHIDIKVTNRLINVFLTDKNNIREISIIIELKILDILSKNKVYIPDYIKEQVKQSFNLKNKIQENKVKMKYISDNLKNE